MHLGFVTGLVLLLVPLANCITSCPSEMAPKIKLTYFDIEGAYKYLAWWKAGSRNRLVALLSCPGSFVVRNRRFALHRMILNLDRSNVFSRAHPLSLNYRTS
jgi:hypothetical protein